MFTCILALSIGAAPPPVEPLLISRPPVVIIERPIAPSVIIVEPSYKSSVLRNLDWGMVLAERRTAEVVTAAQPYARAGVARAKRATRMALASASEWLGFEEGSGALPPPAVKSPDEKPADKVEKEKKIAKDDIPDYLEKKAITDKEGIYLATYTRKDYSGIDEPLSGSHMCVIVVGKDSKLATAKAQEVLELMRKADPTHFRLATPVGKEGWVITQGDTHEEVLGVNAIVRARGEVSQTHNHVVEWLKTSSRIKLLQPE